MTAPSSNTHIRIKRSSANSSPDVLQAGELAYSYLSNTAFIGTADGLGVLKLGGAAYTAVIDAATSAATANTLVLRDTDGSFNANQITANNISVETGNVRASTLYATEYYGALGTATGVESGTWGSSTQVPVLDIAANGLITGVTTANISTTMGFTDGTNTETLNLIDGTLSVLGVDGITSTVTANTITIGVDDTILRSNTEGGPQHVSTDVEISGNLTVQGTTTYINTSINQTSDSLIELAANNTVGDVLDIGFYGKHEGVDGTVVTGLVRNAGSSDYYLFDNIALGDQANLTSNLITQEALSANGASLYAKQYLAADIGTSGGFAFNTAGGNTGMFSPNDGTLQFYSGGTKVGEINNTNGGTSFGAYSADSNQGYRAVAIGYGAGQTDQGGWSTAVGLKAANVGQGTSSVAIGHRAGSDYQGQWAVAVGVNSGQNNQGQGATALGYRAGYGVDSPQGDFSLALGAYAGQILQVSNSIAINASGNDLNPSESGLYIDPIRANNAVGGNVTTYNTTTKEVVYTDVVIDTNGITLANGTTITDADSGFFVDSLREDATANDIVYYNSTTKEMTYGTLADIRADVLSNGAFAWTISGTDGSLTSNVGTSIAASANSVVIGQNVDVTNPNIGRVAIGEYAGQQYQSQHAVAIGSFAGNDGQSISAIAIGENAGETSQSFSAVALGRWAGQTNQGWASVAIGRIAGRTNQGGYSTALGYHAAETNQGTHSVAVGDNAGSGNQSAYAVAVGSSAGYISQGWGAAAFGTNAGYDTQGLAATAIGSNAGRYNQSQGAVAVGRRAGETTQGYYSVAMGNRAGSYQQGQYSIAIGAYAGVNSQNQNSIVFNASGTTLDAGAAGLYINPIRYEETQDSVDDGIMFYNQTTKEVRYSYVLDGGSF